MRADGGGHGAVVGCARQRGTRVGGARLAVAIPRAHLARAGRTVVVVVRLAERAVRVLAELLPVALVEDLAGRVGQLRQAREAARVVYRVGLLARGGHVALRAIAWMLAREALVLVGVDLDARAMRRQAVLVVAGAVEGTLRLAVILRSRHRALRALGRAIGARTVHVAVLAAFVRQHARQALVHLGRHVEGAGAPSGRAVRAVALRERAEAEAGGAIGGRLRREAR